MNQNFLKLGLMTFFIAFANVQAQLQELQPEQEKRAQAIDKLLMAPCCWAKTVAEDNSGMAFGVREQVRDLILAGKSDAEVLAYFEDEYGEKILSSPKKESFNLFLWILPFVLMPLLMLLLYKIILSWKKPIEQSKSRMDAQINEPNVIQSEQDNGYKNEIVAAQDYEKYAKRLDQELYGEDKD